MNTKVFSSLSLRHVGIIGLLLAVMLLLVGCSTTTSDSSINTTDNTAVEESTDDTAVVATGETKEFDIVARQWEFEPETVTVQEGDTVKFSVFSEDVDHGIGLTEFGVNERLAAGETTEFEFVADTTGTYSFFCNVFCGSGHGSMTGTLVVQ